MNPQTDEKLTESFLAKVKRQLRTDHKKLSVGAMYQSFTARNFKCFNRITLENLGRINLIAGMNDTGKTALLEALFIHSGMNPELVIRISVFRGVNPVTFEIRKQAEAPWDSIFRMLDKTQVVELAGNFDNYPERVIHLKTIPAAELSKVNPAFISSEIVNASGQKNPLSSETYQGLRLEINEGGKKSHHDILLDFIQSSEGNRIRIHVIPSVPPAPFQSVFMPARILSLEEDVNRFGKLEATKRLGGILKALRILEPRLKDLAIITERGTPLIAGDIGFDRFVPLPYMGEGVTRLMSLLLAIGFAENGVVLIDEIENGLHYSVLERVWRAIEEAARDFDVQIFATTHSFECINSAHTAFMNRKDYDFRLYRLERLENETSVVSYTKETLSAAIEAGYEVR